ncbi:radical SAM protein [Xanthomonas phage JGB6]|nr:radical SAM protein [Xanthomonas phage JGB6]
MNINAEQLLANNALAELKRMAAGDVGVTHVYANPKPRQPFLVSIKTDSNWTFEFMVESHAVSYAKSITNHLGEKLLAETSPMDVVQWLPGRDRGLLDEVVLHALMSVNG